MVFAPSEKKEVLANLRNFSDLVSEGQSFPYLTVCRSFRSFGTRFAGDIHTWKFVLIAKRGPHERCGPPLCKTMFWQIYETNLVSQGQRLQNLAVWRWFWWLGTRCAGDIHTWKFGPLAKRDHISRMSPLCKTRFWQLFETSLIWSAKGRGS